MPFTARAVRSLLATLDPLPHHARMRHLAQWARTSPRAPEVCAALRAGTDHERRLALIADLARGDTAGIDAAAADPVPALRKLALGAAARAGRLPLPITGLAAADRRHVYRVLRRDPVPALADRLIGTVRDHFGDDEAGALLVACGPETVRALLPQLAHAVRLESLNRRHPGALAEHLTATLAAVPPEHRRHEWARSSGAVLALAPAQALDLLERCAPETELPGRLTGYGVLAAHDPGRVARLLAAPARAGWLRHRRLSPKLLRRLATLPDDDVIPLFRHVRESAPGFAALLRAFAPARRGALYDAALAEVDTTTLIPADEVMEALPATVRIREATRVLGLDRIREQESLVLHWSAYLAWPQAATAQEAALRSGDATERARGYTRLIAAASRARDPEAVAAVVARLTRMRNEQDPVRATALTELAQVAGLLTAGSAADLTTITTDAVEARDASAATTTALSRLATGTLQHHVDVPALRDWSLLAIDLVSTAATVPVLRRFDRVLRRGQETMVFDRLRPWVEAAIARGRYAPLFALTDALGRRAHHLPELQRMLRDTIPGTTARIAETAIARWLDDPRHRAARVAEVLAADPSAVLLGPVWRIVAGTRTDLLDRVLARRPTGRFANSRGHWAPGGPARPDRWLPRQHAAFVDLQAAIVADPGGPVWSRIAALHIAAPAGDPGRDLVLRHVDAPEVPLAEAALGALVWSARPDLALPVLLRHAADDRARVALYAAARAAKHLPPAVLAPPLEALLSTSAVAKVTSRKEAVRILARYGPPDSVGRLLAVFQDPATHRDIRAAIIGAARQRLDTEPSWTVLDLAVAAGRPREERRAVLAADPYLIAARHRPRYAALVVAACRADDPEIRREAFARLPGWSRWAPAATDLIVERLTDLVVATGDAVTPGLLRAAGPEALARALSTLVTREDAETGPGAPGGDHPARRRIGALLRTVGALARALPADADRTGLREPVRALAEHPGHLAAAVATLVTLGRLDNLAEIADRCADRPVLAARIAERVGARLRELPEWPAVPVLQDLIATLAARGDLPGGLFAVALVRAGDSFSWAGRWRDLLLSLRAHPEPEVRDDAWSIDMT